MQMANSALMMSGDVKTGAGFVNYFAWPPKAASLKSHEQPEIERIKKGDSRENLCTLDLNGCG